MSRRLAILLAACLAAVCALPSAAGAVLSGRNGRIVFTSGPPFGATKLFLRSVTSSTGGGSITGPLDTTFTDQYRHPTWSPDRTKIAFAEGPGGTTGYDIYILDLTTGVLQNLTQSSGVTDDRPAWSPDGTRIAYESGSPSDIIVHTLAGGPDLNLTSGLTPKAWKVAWSPDSKTVYYSVGDIAVAPNGNNNDVQIYRQPADDSAVGTVFLHIGGAHVFQPSISPDGTKLCYTTSATASSLPTDAAVLVAPLSSPGSFTIIAASGKGDYNCTWSPDGTEIAYTEDYGGSGEIFMANSDGSSPSPINLTNNTGVFDGNPDWAPDGPPVCPARTVQVSENTPTTITLQCNDTGPAYEQTPVREAVANDGDPTHGKLSDVTIGTPSTVVYTPTNNFLGSDAMKIIGFDDFGFGTDEGTITINVVRPTSPPPGGANGAPVISKLRVSRQIKKAGVLPHLVRTPRPTISFTLTEDATVRLSFARALPGTRVRRHGRVVCVKPAPGSRKRCVRYVGVRTKISLKAKKGVNRVVFYGRLSRRHSLTLGAYRLTAVASDAQGGTSKPTRARFRLVRPKR